MFVFSLATLTISVFRGLRVALHVLRTKRDSGPPFCATRGVVARLVREDKKPVSWFLMFIIIIVQQNSGNAFDTRMGTPYSRLRGVPEYVWAELRVHPSNETLKKHSLSASIIVSVCCLKSAGFQECRKLTSRETPFFRHCFPTP